MRHLSAVVLVVVLFAMPSCKYFKGRGLFGKKVDTMAVWQARQDSIRVADSIKSAQAALLAEESARADSIRKAAEERNNKYNIIVGSFITPEYAERLSSAYREKGYDTHIIKMEGSRFELVSAESYANIGKALARVREFQDNIENDAWIYIRK
ncbi:MAG TPA: hypothetical protein VJ963_02445 [Bacteroidales bacterium]|nr:hypothetical protein [Bacteroidales bacterium]